MIDDKKIEGLNPCCDGRWSRTKLLLRTHQLGIGLNPCCDGRWSRTAQAGC